MFRMLLIGLLLVTGCQGTLVGPRQRAYRPERSDSPGLTIAEQERRARYLIALPDSTPVGGPKTYGDFVTPNGRYAR